MFHHQGDGASGQYSKVCGVGVGKLDGVSSVPSKVSVGRELKKESVASEHDVCRIRFESLEQGIRRVVESCQ